MVLKLHGVCLSFISAHLHPVDASDVQNSMSTCTKRVAAILKEKEVPFEFIPIPFGASKAPEYKEKMQPFGQIPVLEDDGFFLYGKLVSISVALLRITTTSSESRAIARYIALKYAKQGTPNLIPSGENLQETALFERAMSIEATQFTAAESLTMEALFKP